MKREGGTNPHFTMDGNFTIVILNNFLAECKSQSRTFFFGCIKWIKDGG